ncbi:HAD family hydrolase [Chitinophaga barathri]|uniref:HAD family phosphatase n=1 Tax=Chitinophaga barathri TaxID=1647451 RepID=A0A3N4MA09_9BACT|nr:HAD family phosphatase [Chitinophaga barathri]RPD38506.1 HAD family phosphatase [Chitinophaga barathri]
MQGIKHIIFDLGGVILNIDYRLTSQAFKDLGAQNFDELYNQFHANSLFEDLETGRVTNGDFLASIKEHLPEGTTDEQIVHAWNAMLLDFPVARLQLLQQLRNHYDLFLLSNTNAIHLEALNKQLERERGIPSLASFFDRSYYSNLIGYRKPEKESYQVILDENGLKPEHTLFIDDTLPNIDGAKALGIQTIHLQAPKTILDIFRKG